MLVLAVSAVTALALAGGSDAGVGAPARAWPVRGRLTSPFGWRTDPISRTRQQFHRGVDLAAPTGTPVLSPVDGVIERVNEAETYGLAVWVRSGPELHLLAHLSRQSVVPGQVVAAGQLVGAVGCTGTRCTGPHLHWQVTIRDELVDPLQLMEAP